MTEVEGVTRFRARHRRGPLPAELEPLAAELSAWRSILRGVGAIGQTPERYGGYGFGNLSARVGEPDLPPGRRALLVTGTQTGGAAWLEPSGYSVVEAYDLAAAVVDSRGPSAPSSESMTHGAIYDLAPDIGAVAHGHLPELWTAAAALDLPRTAAGVGYGTPEMAAEIGALHRAGQLRERPVLAMAGHEDGVIAFGATIAAACQALLEALVAARVAGARG